MTEKQFEALLMEYFQLKGLMVWKNQSSGTYDPRKKIFYKNPNIRNGIPDLSVAIKGKVYFIEIKKPTMKPLSDERLSKMLSEAQVSFISDLRDSGVSVIVTNHIEHMEQKFKEIGIYL